METFVHNFVDLTLLLIIYIFKYFGDVGSMAFLFFP